MFIYFVLAIQYSLFSSDPILLWRTAVSQESALKGVLVYKLYSKELEKKKRWPQSSLCSAVH